MWQCDVDGACDGCHEGAGRIGGELTPLLWIAVTGLVDLLVGPFLGAFTAELIARRDVAHAGRAGLGTWLGLLLGVAGKLGLVVAMVAIFVVAYLR